MNPQQDWIKDSLMASINNGFLRAGRRLDAVERVANRLCDPNRLVRDEQTAESHLLLDCTPVTAIVTPHLDHAGLCSEAPNFADAQVYLSPMLEIESQAYVDFVVAHEFAHIVLGHWYPGAVASADPKVAHSRQPHEKAADALARSWGFHRPRGKNNFQKLCDKVVKEGL